MNSPNPAYYEALATARGVRPAPARSWSILLTSTNHGVVGPCGSTFPHAGEHHERVVVVEVPAGAGAPIDQVNLQFVTGTARQADVDRALKAALAWANEEYVCARNLGKGGPGTHEACDAKKAECIAAISALGTPVAAQAGQVAVPEAVRVLREAIQKQLAPDWECNSNHPALFAALKATGRLAATAKESK